MQNDPCFLVKEVDEIFRGWGDFLAAFLGKSKVHISHLAYFLGSSFFTLFLPIFEDHHFSHPTAVIFNYFQQPQNSGL